MHSPRSRLGFDEPAVRRALSGRRVLLTGHTGFKGGWLALWLQQLGADVVGVALPPPAGPSLFETLGIETLVDSRIGDIRTPEGLASVIGDVDADLVFHLAAQAIVRRSFADPVDTFLTNVVGTATVLQASARMPNLRGIVVVTSDKCYDNREWEWGYRETDPMGGADPYSASKGCAELVAASYRHSFFGDPDGPQLATVRAGNVVGGGDWSQDRLVPDIVRATLKGVPVELRNPRSVRPWQHVFDALAGYLTVATRLLEDGDGVAEAWNFGPEQAQEVNVGALADAFVEAWGPGGPTIIHGQAPGPHEARSLALDSAKARNRLGWRPTLGLSDTVALTADWYRAWASQRIDMREFSVDQIAGFVAASAPSSVAFDNQLSASDKDQGVILQCA